jgi:hypothetical protein
MRIKISDLWDPLNIEINVIGSLLGVSSATAIYRACPL